jgi:hypothetical protein
VVATARDRDIVPFALEALHQARAEEPSTAGDENPHGRKLDDRRGVVRGGP